MNLSVDVGWLLLALLLVALNGFFVAAEFAIVKLRRTRIDELRRQHGVRGRLLAAVHGSLDAYLSACQLGITLASLGLGWVGEPAFARLLEAPLAAIGIAPGTESAHLVAFLVAFVTISYLHIVVGELAPKSAALRKPESISLWTAAPLYLFYWAMYPFIWFLNLSANRVLRWFGLGAPTGHEHEAPYTFEELRVILHLSHPASQEDHATSEVNRMLAHTLDLPVLHASDVMRTRREMVFVRNSDDAAAVRRTLQLHRFSRYPCVDADNGEVLGVLLHKDIVFEPPGPDYAQRLRAHVRRIEHVREDTPISTLLRYFRQGAPHLTLVEDEDGRVVGFVTLEDVLEAIFGEIRDEHETARTRQIRREPQWLADDSLIARGDTPLFMLERELRCAIGESESLSTVAGLLMERLGRMPMADDEILVGDYRARVLRVKGTVIEAVRFTLDDGEAPVEAPR